ncbi:cyclic nucleotide-binding domain-containing protein, partial [bacterium]|nr:cyclic nucleotide-binding domain-containing protein [bacterium]
MRTVSDLQNFLASVELFKNLDPGDIQRLAGQFESVPLKGGTTLIRQGDAGDSLYILRTGKLRVTQVNKRGREVTVSMLGSGDCVGEIALLTGENRSATVHVETDSDILVLEKKRFEEISQYSPRTADHFSKIIVENLQRGELRNLLYVNKVFKDLNRAALNDLESVLELF